MQVQISWCLQKPANLDLHCLLRQGMSCSAREGLVEDSKVSDLNRSVFSSPDNTASTCVGDGWVRQRCRVSCVTGASNWLAYSWARPAILAADTGRGGMFLFLLFLHFYSFSSFYLFPLLHLLYYMYLFYLWSPFLRDTTQNDPQRLLCH